MHAHPPPEIVAVRATLTRAEWQPILFGTPDRAELAALAPEWELLRARIRVHRNHGFEAVSSAVAAYAAWNGFRFDFDIGAYDDTLSFDVREEADADLLWFDTGRIESLAREEVSNWLCDRLRALRAHTTAPILVLAWPLSDREREALEAADVPGVHVADLSSLAASLGAGWTDTRATSLSGTRLGNQACLHVARELAGRWLPALVGPPRKVVALDLDGTLYRGVLGEDGARDVELTAGHEALQRRLREYRNAGVLLGLVTRNERADVEGLFALRPDFPLSLSDFSALEISWDDKATALRRVAAHLRIGADSIVFVDDNPGELAAVAGSLPVFTVHASEDAAQTAAALDHVGGLFRWRNVEEDCLRAEDLHASQERALMQEAAASPEEYLRSLQVRLEFLVGAREHVPRMAEISARTNQFNLSLRRLNEAEIERRLAERRANVVAIRLTDRLSDSGIVGLVVGRRVGDALQVEEACVSCRALGRGLEDIMLTKALLVMSGESRPRKVVFTARKGPRNEPARQWLAKYADAASGDDEMVVQMEFSAISRKPISAAVVAEVVT